MYLKVVLYASSRLRATSTRRVGAITRVAKGANKSTSESAVFLKSPVGVPIFQF